MYRIHFDHVRGVFIIQVATGPLGLFWRTVMNKAEVDFSTKKHIPLEFDTYRNACLHVDTIGLSALYDDRSDNKRRKFMALA